VIIFDRVDQAGVRVLLPHLADVVIERINEVGGAVRIWARPRAGRGACPCCGAGSARVHSRYERRLADAAVAGRRVEIQLRVDGGPGPG
jgi:transposase